MALKVRFENPIERYRLTADSIVYYPDQLVSYFQRKDTFEIEPSTYFYIWVKGESLEWENDTSKNFSKIQAILNKILQPIGKMVQFSLNPEKITFETFDDGFFIFSLNPLKLVAR